VAQVDKCCVLGCNSEPDLACECGAQFCIKHWNSSWVMMLIPGDMLDSLIEEIDGLVEVAAQAPATIQLLEHLQVVKSQRDA